MISVVTLVQVCTGWEEVFPDLFEVLTHLWQGCLCHGCLSTDLSQSDSSAVDKTSGCVLMMNKENCVKYHLWFLSEALRHIVLCFCHHRHNDCWLMMIVGITVANHRFDQFSTNWFVLFTWLCCWSVDGFYSFFISPALPDCFVRSTDS